jgi:hypothetical protein
MTIGSILLGVALLILVVLFLARPFVQRPTSPHLPRTKRQRLLAQKEAALTEIMALEFDYETGKIPAELYQPQRATMVAEAAALLQELDALPPTDRIDAEIEAAIAQMRGQTAVTPPVTAPAAVLATGKNGHGRFCTQCGSPIDPGDKFCAHCGHKINNRLEEEADNVPEKSVGF